MGIDMVIQVYEGLTQNTWTTLDKDRFSPPQALNKEN